jgi:uncharacterized protein
VIAIDTNILVYAHRSDITWHEKAVATLMPLLEGRTPWAIAWPCVHEFLGVVTNKRIYSVPTPIELAFAQIREWSMSSSFRFIGEAPEHLSVLEEIANAAQVTGGLIHDARIAAICMQHGVRQLWTADRDFSRFPDLKTYNPLVN